MVSGEILKKTDPNQILQSGSNYRTRRDQQGATETSDSQLAPLKMVKPFAVAERQGKLCPWLALPTHFPSLVLASEQNTHQAVPRSA